MPGVDQPLHWIFLVILAGLLFGGYKKLPEMARSAGRSMRVFKTELKGLEDDDQARATASQAIAHPESAGFAPPVAVAQPVPFAPAVGAAQPTASPEAVVPLPAPAVAAPVAAGPAPLPTQQHTTPTSASSYVATEPASDPTAPPRA